jgi:hypothetical protein
VPFININLRLRCCGTACIDSLKTGRAVNQALPVQQSVTKSFIVALPA